MPDARHAGLGRRPARPGTTHPQVQCKRTVGSSGAPDVQKLTGTLAPGGQELGLFLTLGSYSKDAVHLGRTRQDLRLINGNELVDLVFEHYEDFDPGGHVCEDDHSFCSVDVRH